MAGYIGSKSSVTLVDGYTEAEADAEFVNDPSSVITVDGGNVGIGTDSPVTNLDVVTTSAGTRARVYSNTTSTPSSGLELCRGTDSTFGADNYTDFLIENINGGHLGFKSGINGTTSERMRIDSTGKVLVGKTASGMTANGVELRTGVTNDYAFTATSLNQPVLLLNRQTDDGMIIRMRKGNTDVGSIGTQGSRLSIGSGDVNLNFNASANSMYPISDPTAGTVSDGIVDLGAALARFDDIYATNGTIQTSDFNEKQDIASLTATEMLVGKRISVLFKTFRWKDSVAEKGDNARTHTGVIAQDVQVAFTAEGLDAGDYALFTSFTWWEQEVDVPAVEAVAEVTDEDGNVTTKAVEAVDAYTSIEKYDTEAEAPEGSTERTRLGIRYPELLSFVAAYNEQRFASIEARLTALEA